MEYTISEIVEKLNLGSEGTVRNWEEAINLQVPHNNKGHRRYTDYELSILSQVKEMREQNIDFTTIAGKLNLTSKSDIAKEVVESPVLLNELTNNLNLMRTEMTERLDNKLEKFTEISQVYAASYKVGSLEPQLQAEKDKLNVSYSENIELKDNLKVVNQDIARKNKEVLELTDKLNELEKALSEYKNLAWYKKIFTS